MVFYSATLFAGKYFPKKKSFFPPGCRRIHFHSTFAELRAGTATKIEKRFWSEYRECTRNGIFRQTHYAVKDRGLSVIHRSTAPKEYAMQHVMSLVIVLLCVVFSAVTGPNALSIQRGEGSMAEVLCEGRDRRGLGMEWCHQHEDEEDQTPVDCSLVENCFQEECLFGDELRFNEVQPHPDFVPDATGEYVELKNRGNRCVHLKGWSFVESNGWKTFFPGDAVVPAGGFYVVAGEMEQPEYCEFSVDHVLGTNVGLNDNGDQLVLYNAQNEFVASMEYADECPLGASLFYCPGNGWYCSSENYGYADLCPNQGTPGSQNDCASIEN